MVIYNLPAFTKALNEYEQEIGGSLTNMKVSAVKARDDQKVDESPKISKEQMMILQNRLNERFEASKIGPKASADFDELNKIFDNFVERRHTYTVRPRTNPNDPGYSIEKVDTYGLKVKRKAMS